jgi:hypothetical protein
MVIIPAPNSHNEKFNILFFIKNHLMCDYTANQGKQKGRGGLQAPRPQGGWKMKLA